MKRVIVLGITGSIGQQTDRVITRHEDEFVLIGFSTWHQDNAIPEIINRHPHVKYIAVQTDAQAAQWHARYPDITFFSGDAGLIELASLPSYDVVVTALVGFAGLAPTWAAIETHHDVALANKETLVVAGELMMPLAKQHGVTIYPIDSEHSALTQALYGESLEQVETLLLTASGGPFRELSRTQLSSVTPQQALAHPTWSMGAKISIDSATMVNKGLEVIEAHFLFNIPYDAIHVVIHPQSMVHSMVQYQDGSIKAQIGPTTMEIPILYALAGHQHRKDLVHRLDWKAMKSWTFAEPSIDRYPALRLAYQVGRKGGNAPCVFNAANEVAVAAFLEGKLAFHRIEEVIEYTIQQVPWQMQHSLQSLIQCDRESRQIATRYLVNLEVI